jgi:hypothetical protein
MRLWRREDRGDRHEGVSDEQRLAQLLDQLADDIADDGDDKITLDWSLAVRDCAGAIRAGSARGLSRFFEVFSSDPRNTINEQRFTRTRTFDEAHQLASKLLQEHESEMRRSSQEAATALRPWTEGSTGKAIVYKDGTVVATEDDASGNPHIADIGGASRPDEDPVATIAIRPNGSCAVYRHYDGDERWLAERLHEHHPALHLEQRPPRG